MFPIKSKEAQDLIQEFRKHDLTKKSSQEGVKPSQVKSGLQEKPPKPLSSQPQPAPRSAKVQPQGRKKRMPPPINAKRPPPPPPDVIPQTSRQMSIDEQGYLIPEEIGIPRYVRDALNAPSTPIDSSKTLPRLKPRELSGSLPMEHVPMKHSRLRNSSTGNLSLGSLSLNASSCKANAVEKKHSRPLPATPPSPRIGSERQDLTRFPWFQDMTRNEAESAVSSGGIDGQYLVRKSVHGGLESPFTLTLYYQRRIFNLNIRILSEGQCILGKKKSGEMIFQSVKDMIEFHKVAALKLVDKDGLIYGQTVLVQTPRMSKC